MPINRPTQHKRQRERAQQERRKATAERRQAAKARRAAAEPRGQDGVDPDIAGIRPGPQPSPYVDLFPSDAPEDE